VGIDVVLKLSMFGQFSRQGALLKNKGTIGATAKIVNHLTLG
jgi:hypothetical protein